MRNTTVRIIAAIIALGTGTAMSAEAPDNALSLHSRATLRRHAVEKKVGAKGLRKLAGRTAGSNASVAFLLTQPGTTSEDIEAEGMRVLTMRGDIAVVEVQLADVERCAKADFVRSFQLQRELKPHLDLAREATGVNTIHAGTDPMLTRSYTGAGVVAGIVDQGVDPNHINFLNADGSARIRFLSHLRYNAAGTGLAEDFYGADVRDGKPISSFSTDDASTYHGTHTLGILGGAYDGNVEVATGVDAANKPIYESIANPYKGVATGADLAVSCGELADGFIAYGIEYMYGYSEFLGQPMVLSLSLGSNSGPHDPNSTMARFLDAVGEEAIVCISSGNEGDLKIALNKTFTADDKQIKTLIHPYSYRFDPEGGSDFTNNTIRYGAIEIYSNDATPFDLQAVIYNAERNYRVAKRLPKVGDGVGTYYCSSADYQMDESDVVGDATFVRAFDGYVGVGGQIDEETGRYYGMVDYYVIDSDQNKEKGNYVLGFEVTGSEGQRIDCYGDGLTTWMESYGLEGFDDGSCNGSISDMAVAHNVIVVGSFNTRNTFSCLDGFPSNYVGDGFVPGGISGFSSFGTLADGRNLPTICGPGSAIISSMSTPYLNVVTADYSQTNAEGYINYLCNARATDASGKRHYWKQEIGTSMSTPFVAGSIALWLEADPTLKVDEVREIIQATATVDADVQNADPVRWGAGKFNALEGLKEVVRRAGAGIGNVSLDANNDRLIVSKSAPGVFDIFCGDASGSISAEVYALSGTRMYSVRTEGDQISLDTAGWAAGVYIVNVNNRHSTKIVVK